MAKRKAFLCLEVTNRNWKLKYTGSVDCPKPDDKEKWEHDELIMRALVSDEKLFNLFYRLFKPVERYYRRKAIRQQKENHKS